MDSTSEPIEEGALQAYLEGERLPHVVEAIASSPQLQAQLEILARANERLHALAPQTVIPNSQDLVDVAAGQATARQQLRVAAYLRLSAAGRARMAYLLESQRAQRQGAPTLFLATPPVAAGATKGEREGDRGGAVLVSAELAAHVVVRIQPVAAGLWRLRGYLEQRGEPLGATVVVLRTPDGRRRTRTTDDGGFFAFERLPAGSYHLRIRLDAGVLLTPPIMLGDAQ
ncbi:MAG: carboxypeptidase regulatory-like domain-containing protein [Oscillochloris sp.]|nr:carboxypeptidase regulatory-like domain-containing protein [Oscillochloris sp.]